MLERDAIEFERARHEVRGRGEDWRRVWEAFCALAREPADEPFDRHGLRLHVDTRYTDNDLLLHESGSSEGVPFWLSVRRQFSFADEQEDYAGMNVLALEFECERGPQGRAPTAQRWGYAGLRRDDVSDEAHPEMARWAGWVEQWKSAVEASNSFKVLAEIQPVRWLSSQGDI
jgi:hypothetical protein